MFQDLMISMMGQCYITTITSLILWESNMNGFQVKFIARYMLDRNPFLHEVLVWANDIKTS